MSSINSQKISTKQEMKANEDEYNIKIFRRTLENYTHEVIEDTKIKKVTSWRKSQSKFMKSLILNILTFGVLHIISLFYPNLYIKLYCHRRNPKECDFFLVEDIYGKLTLCKKIYKKDKIKSSINFSSDTTNHEIISSSLSNFNSKVGNSLIKNLTYSFKYKSVTYEYNEITNEIKPVYLNLSNLTCKDIFNFFSEGLSSEGIVKIFQNRYGKNEYNINFNLINLYFHRIEIPNLILVIIIGIIDLILKDIISFITKVAIIIVILLAEYINMKLTIYGPYKCEYTLDGEKSKIKAKRSHKFDPKSEIFCLIDNCDLLPGDIIFLKSGDYVPCDCLIIEGECMANSDNLIGNLNMLRKVPLENKNVAFNYQLNKDNILYHGMKITKTYSNLKHDFISVLCINTGPNSFKANQFSNILYYFDRKKEYKDDYLLFKKDRKVFFIIIFAILIVSFLACIAYIMIIFKHPSELIDFKNKYIRDLFIKIMIRFFCKSVMPTFYLFNSIIILIGVIILKYQNVLTFEKSKILSSSKIDTLFISKTGTLCDDKFEIIGFHPIAINSHNMNNLGFRTYNVNQNKELNSQLVKYYKEYLDKLSEMGDSNFKKIAKVEYNKNIAEKISHKCYEYSTLFLETLLSCNNLEKYGMEIFGNSIDYEIFKEMKWDIKADINSNNFFNSDVNYSYHKTEHSSNFSKTSCYEKTINDIFPSNYYKITESVKNKNEKNHRNSFNVLFSNTPKIIEENHNHRGSLLSNKLIERDISQNNINSYKIRIYKRFVKENCINSSSITYNFITKELRFNTKGIPEYILDKCISNTIPDNLEKIIAFYRKKGYIIIICASKKISIDLFDELDNEDKYMNNLTFYGFVTLKNKLKDDVVHSLNDLRAFNINFKISTGDDIYNTLSIGFASTILENKDIYSFDEDKNRILIKKIHSCDYNKKIENTDNNNDNTTIENSSRISKNNNKILDKVFKSPKSKLKQSKIFENSENSLNTYLKAEKKLDKFNLEGNKFSLSKESISEISNAKTRNIKNVNGTNTLVSSKEFLNDKYKNSIATSNKNIKKMIKMSKKNLNSFEFNVSDTPRNTFISNKKIINTEKNEGLYYYPSIFEDHKELDEDCIYCVSGKIFEILYHNKSKINSKILLEKIHQKCRIFYNMTSLSKSKVIDYYREFPDNYICTIGECQSDFDPILTSDIGINLQSPKNLNTILCHFYSPEANLSSIKKIIMVGRAINENILLMKIACGIYTLMLNSYILACFLRKIDVIQGQLNFLELAFLFLSLSAFTAKADNKSCENSLIQKKKLYICHYIFQIFGLILNKTILIYFHAIWFNTNDFVEISKVDKIYATFYFMFCIEHLFSTIFVLNLISFYRRTWLFNAYFITLSLLIFCYYVILLTLTNSNYNVDIFGFLYYEFLENIVDAYDENNKQSFFLVCLLDFSTSVIYSRVVYYIFNKLSKFNYGNKKK